MKGTESFKDVIKTYLDNRSASDELFAKNYAKTSKSLEDCITYILNQVKKSGCNGFADDEIYSMAVHYYDEDDLSVGSPINCQVIINHKVELTEEEKEQARKDAIKAYQAEQIKKMQEKSKPKPKVGTASLPSLFD